LARSATCTIEGRISDPPIGDSQKRFDNAFIPAYPGTVCVVKS
jgi:hypothetical protein